MSRTVIAGLDGTVQSLAAADWAAREAQLRSLPLVLVHAWKWQPYAQAPLGGMPLPANAPERGWAERMLADARSAIAEQRPELPISTREADDDTVPALLAAAGEAEVLVLGSRGLSGLAGFVVGSVALAVVGRVNVPVVLVRAGERAENEHATDIAGRASAVTPYRDVVLGLDLEHPDDAVVGFAFDAAVRRGTGLRVVHGWSPPPYYYGYAGVLDPESNAQLAARIRQDVTGVLRGWRARFPAVDVAAQAVIGGAGPHLVEASRDASLVVVGRRNGRTTFGAHIGPVTQTVMHHAAAPVAVIPHD